MSQDTELTVRTLLAEAGLSPDEGEIATLVAGYPGFKEGIEALYAIPEARYTAPALTFTATPTFVDWAS